MNNFSKLCDKIAVIMVLLVLSISGIFMIGNGVKKAMQYSGIISEKSQSRFTKIDIAWDELYPFKDKIDIERGKVNSIIETLKLYINIGKEIKSKISSGDFFPEKTLFLEYYAKINSICGVTKFNDRVLLKNGYIYQVNGETSDEAIELTVNNIKDFSDWLGENNIPFLFAPRPCKASKYDNQLPDYIQDYSNVDYDKILELLEEAGVSCFDMRKEIYNQGINHYDLFFKTDHHWTVDGGMWGAKAVANELNDRFNFELDTDILDISNYTKTVYQNIYLGSDGRAVTLGYTEPEDFFIYSPKFETSFHVVHPDLDIDMIGTFDDTMYNKEILSKEALSKETLGKRDLYNNDIYDALMYSTRPFSQVVNYKAENKYRILFISNSYVLALAPYFSLMNYETDLIDVRPSMGNFTGSVKTYIEETKPDAVVLLYNSGTYSFD